MLGPVFPNSKSSLFLCLWQGEEKMLRSGALRVLDHAMTGVAKLYSCVLQGKEKVAVRRTALAGSCL
jgi:hypothetical protein